MTSANEGPSKSDWKQSREKPACGEGCEHVHGDQADPDLDELVRLRGDVFALRRQLAEAGDQHQLDHKDLEAARAENKELRRQLAVWTNPVPPVVTP